MIADKIIGPSQPARVAWILGSLIGVAALSIPAAAFDQSDLDLPRALWDSSGITDYNYIMQRSCFCSPDSIQPGFVKVRGDILQDVRHADTLEPLDPANFLTVDELFDTIQDALDLGAFQITAEFDDVLGYPRGLAIDYNESFADDEISYTARDLTAVPEPASVVLLAGAMLLSIGRMRRIGGQRTPLSASRLTY